MSEIRAHTRHEAWLSIPLAAGDGEVRLIPQPDETVRIEVPSLAEVIVRPEQLADALRLLENLPGPRNMDISAETLTRSDWTPLPASPEPEPADPEIKF